MISRSAWFAVLVSTCAIGQKTDFVKVRVLTDGQNCVVFEQQMDCDSVGTYLKDTRHLPFSRSILVDLDVGEGSRAGGLKVGQSLKAAGFSHFYTVGFITDPRSDPAR